MPLLLTVLMFFALGVEGGKVEGMEKEKSVEEWAREGQCVPSRYWKGTWVCGKGGKDWPTVWFDLGEGK